MKHKIPDTIFGKPVKGAIKRALTTNFNSENPAIEQPQRVDTNFSDNVAESYIMSYDHPQHGQFFQELIKKSNERFKGTKAEISEGTSGEVQNMYSIKRMALVSTIANNSNLRSAGLWPISPLQSETLLKDGKLPDPSKYWEDLGLIVYDLKGENKKEAKSLRESIRQNLSVLGLTENDLEKRLLVVHAGAEVDPDMSHGVKPIIIPGITQVYTHEVLDKIGANHTFEYGLDRGLPFISEIGKGDRTLYMPNEKENVGLRVLYRDWDLDLGSDWGDLRDSGGGGRVNFARSASP